LGRARAAQVGQRHRRRSRARSPHLKATRARAAALGLLALAATTRAQAAPCCGGGALLPSLITGDDRAQLTVTASQGAIIGDAPAQGVPVFRADGNAESTRALKLEGAAILAERLQAGLAVPVIARHRELGGASADGSAGLGDVTADLGYEFLPEWTYSRYRPRGFGFVSLTLPTSPSIYDAKLAGGMDARGRGFVTLGLGAVFVKTLGDWDWVAQAEAHRSLPREFDFSDEGSDAASAVDPGRLRLSPGWGGSLLAGVGLSPGGGDLRLGVSVSPAYEGAIQVEGIQSAPASSQLVWNTALQAGYAIAADWSASAAYVDQTLLGPARNSRLSRTLAVALQKRWEP
jgi:hypothetical protein